MYLLINFVFRLINDTEIAKAQRDFELKKAAYDVEIHTKVYFRLNFCIYIKCTLVIKFVNFFGIAYVSRHATNNTTFSYVNCFETPKNMYLLL